MQKTPFSRLQKLRNFSKEATTNPMEGTYIDCGRCITDSLIGRNVTILSHEQNLPKGSRLILGDMATVTL